MNEPAAIAGSLVDVKNINTHKAVRLSIDVPAEQGEQLVKAFGWPTMVDPVPVAVARLEAPVAQRTEQRSSEPRVEGSNPSGVTNTNGSAKPKSYAQRAGILSNHVAFWRFYEQKLGFVNGRISDAETAADFLRIECSASSRRDLIEGTPAGNAFRNLEAEFKAWKQVG